MTEIVFGGKTWPSMNQLCKVFGKHPSTVRKRIANGMSLKDALHEEFARGHKFSINEKKLRTKDLAKALGLAPGTIRKRIEDGWKPTEVVLPRLYRKGVTAFNKTQSVAAWARERGMERSCLRNRLRVMPPELALTLPVKKINRGKKKEAS